MDRRITYSGDEEKGRAEKQGDIRRISGEMDLVGTSGLRRDPLAGTILTGRQEAGVCNINVHTEPVGPPEIPCAVPVPRKPFEQVIPQIVPPSLTSHVIVENTPLSKIFVLIDRGYPPIDTMELQRLSNIGDVIWSSILNAPYAPGSPIGTYVAVPVSKIVTTDTTVSYALELGSSGDSYPFCIVSYKMNGDFLWNILPPGTNNFALGSGPINLMSDNLFIYSLCYFGFDSDMSTYKTQVVKYDSKTGEVIWQMDFNGFRSYYAGCVSEKYVYIFEAINTPPYHDTTTLLLLDKKTGATVTTVSSVCYSAQYANNKIYCFGNGIIQVFSKSGILRQELFIGSGYTTYPLIGFVDDSGMYIYDENIKTVIHASLAGVVKWAVVLPVNTSSYKSICCSDKYVILGGGLVSLDENYHVFYLSKIIGDVKRDIVYPDTHPFYNIFNTTVGVSNKVLTNDFTTYMPAKVGE